MTQRFPPGAQDPKSPHPGSIEAKYYWNDSKETWPISDLPESFIFRCFDKNGERAQRVNAAWCIPVVEVETVSVDENGNPVVPKEADSVSISEYGPGHTFIQHTQSVPHLKRQRELDRQRQSTPQDATTPQRPQSFKPNQSNYTLSDYREPPWQGQLGWWARLKAWIGFG
ncbi:hypothetical protein [Caballeronia udeis]|nr:hypothetical protein [Caballeronia udeis]